MGFKLPTDFILHQKKRIVVQSKVKFDALLMMELNSKNFYHLILFK